MCHQLACKASSSGVSDYWIELFPNWLLSLNVSDTGVSHTTSEGPIPQVISQWFLLLGFNEIIFYSKKIINNKIEKKNKIIILKNIHFEIEKNKINLEH